MSFSCVYVGVSTPGNAISRIPLDVHFLINSFLGFTNIVHTLPAPSSQFDDQFGKYIETSEQTFYSDMYDLRLDCAKCLYGENAECTCWIVPRIAECTLCGKALAFEDLLLEARLCSFHTPLIK